MKKPEAERFMSHVAKAESGCWLWTAYRMPNGYGLFRTPVRHELAHRAAHRLFIGSLDERDVMHACDNRACVNPGHLSLGTHTENMQDAKRKGRTARGESHGRAKLTAKQVEYALTAEKLQREIAEELGVSQGHISALRSGKRWGQPHEGNYHR